MWLFHGKIGLRLRLWDWVNRFKRAIFNINLKHFCRCIGVSEPPDVLPFHRFMKRITLVQLIFIRFVFNVLQWLLTSYSHFFLPAGGFRQESALASQVGKTANAVGSDVAKGWLVKSEHNRFLTAKLSASACLLT
jgi:hypothetical protein